MPLNIHITNPTTIIRILAAIHIENYKPHPLLKPTINLIRNTSNQIILTIIQTEKEQVRALHKLNITNDPNSWRFNPALIKHFTCKIKLPYPTLDGFASSLNKRLNQYIAQYNDGTCTDHNLNAKR